MINFFIAILLFQTIAFSFATDGHLSAKTELKIKKGSVGIIQVQKETNSFYEVKITFPYQELSPIEAADAIAKPIYVGSGTISLAIPTTAYAITTEGPILIFDDHGVVGKIDGILSGFLLNFWCDSCGGFQFRPSLNLTLKKSSLHRSLRPMSSYDHISSFIGIGSITDFQPFPKPFKEIKRGSIENSEYFEHLVMEGRLSTKGLPIARLAESYSEVGCDNHPTDLNLETGGGAKNAPIRCCGP